MPRTLHRLTERAVRHLDVPGYRADGGGLYLQVSKARTKSWIFRYTLRSRTRDMGLGSAATVTLTIARTLAAECRLLVAQGKDPIAEIRGAVAPAESGTPLDVTPTFRQFAESYVESRSSEWRSDKHASQWMATLKQYAFPEIGDMKLRDIDTPDVLRVIEPIWRAKPETASRLRGRIERILAAASVRGFRPPGNPAAWAGHLREALSKKRKGNSFPAMPYADLPAFLITLRSREAISARALEFAILTAARSGEVRGARWCEFDLSARLWTVPGNRMKAGRDHVVPLSSQTLAALEAMLPLRHLGSAEGYVFPGLKPGRHLSDMALSKLVKAMGFSVVPHGFRATFKTWAENETEHANVVIESALAHIVGDKAEQAYMRGDRLTKRKALMDDWGMYCDSCKRLETLRAA